MSDNELININNNVGETKESQISSLQEKFDHFVASLKPEFSALKKDFNSLKEDFYESKERLNDLNSHITELKKLLDTIEEIKSQVSYIKRSTYSKIMYKNDFERKLIQPFKSYYSSPTFQPKLAAMMNGLSQEDSHILLKIISRQQRVLDSEENSQIDLYTDFEKRELKKMREEFKQCVFKVADDLYCYDNYKLPVNHFESSVFWDKHGIKRLSADSLEYIKTKNILDVGGFIGDSIQIFAPLTEKHIYSFEPSKINFDILLKSIELNGLSDKVKAENLAFGEKTESRKLFFSNSSSSFFQNDAILTEAEELVNVTTLDEYIEKNPMEIGMIKVDIEGAEQNFLKGAKKTICAQRPILLLSIYHNPDDFFNIKPIIESWSLDYHFKIHKPIDHTVSREVLLIAESTH